jgi:two-component system, response regulator
MNTLARRHSITILMADDDADDRMITQKALEKNRLANDLRFVVDGEELMDYLHQRGPYAEPGTAPRPGLILLDLNMPRKDGREALGEIKSNAALRSIPVVILTTSKAEEDIVRTYDLGVNSFITKPVSFEQLSEVIATMGQYWLEIVELPTAHHRVRAA